MNLLPLPSLRHASFFPFSSSPLKFSIPTPLPSSLPLPQPSGRAGRLSVKSIGIDDAGDNSRNGEDDSEDEEESSRRPDSRIDGTDIEITSASESFRKNLERMIGKDDMSFTGMDLATLIRKKYGRSYDVQLIKKEFMGKNLLAMNVMWKYMEQRSFPLTEEEYILRLDDVANTLKCWGAVSHVRNTLDKSKERPRIGKAVSIFIDMDDSGGRANEWIYR